MARTLLQETRFLTAALLWGAAVCGAGCCAIPGFSDGLHCGPEVNVGASTPRELNKAVLPPYVIEPPDVLVVEVINVIPKAPYALRPGDALAIQVKGTLPDAPIGGTYRLEPGGTINLGPGYGSVKLAGAYLEDVAGIIEKALEAKLKAPEASVALADLSAMQQVAGEHLVGPDGTVTMGVYGSVYVVGKTVAQARADIESHLSQFLEKPEVAVDVFAYNSKHYYVITQGAGTGDGVFRFPVTGNETVLDAISQIEGLGPVSSKRIWVARPGRSRGGCDQLLDVDWNGITQYGNTCTNYQLMPGDRVYVSEDKLIAFDTGLGKLFAPFERIMGFSLLGVGTVTRFSGPVLRGGGNRQANF